MNKILKLSAIALLASSTSLMAQTKAFEGAYAGIFGGAIGAEVNGYALPPLTEKDNFVTTKLKSRIHHLEGDIRDRVKLEKYFDKIKPEFAFHLAAQPLVIDSYHNPHYNFETNLMGTVNFFEAVRKTSSLKVAVNVTTDKCYRNNEWIWGYRENEAMGGDDPYSASKGCSELITHSYQKSFFSKKFKIAFGVGLNPLPSQNVPTSLPS
mgnify:CR=1 FL=1